MSLPGFLFPPSHALSLPQLDKLHCPVFSSTVLAVHWNIQTCSNPYPLQSTIFSLELSLPDTDMAHSLSLFRPLLKTASYQNRSPPLLLSGPYMVLCSYHHLSVTFTASLPSLEGNSTKERVFISFCNHNLWNGAWL
jgi:hypothetical protein